MSPVTGRGNVVSVLPIIGKINSSQAVFSPRRGNALTIVRFTDLLLKIGKDGNDGILEGWNHVTSF
jgi:hypothetical protein